jgi:hypothetical protein
LSFDAYLPKRGLNCYDSCMSIEVSPHWRYVQNYLPKLVSLKAI